MPPIPPLQSPLSDGHIALRDWTDDDADAMTRAMQDPEISKWVDIPWPYERHHAVAYLEDVREMRARGDEAAFAIVDPETGELLGTTKLRIEWEHLRCEAGSVVFPQARGRRVSVRNGLLVARYAFDHLGLRRLGVLVSNENVASTVATERLGWVREGVLRSYTERGGRRVDVVSFSVLPEDSAAGAEL